MTGDTYLVTGAMGCIGAWVLKHLVARGDKVIASDLGSDPVRPRLLLSGAEMEALEWSTLDVTDGKAVSDLITSKSVTKIIHLAGLQIPFCRANPSLGAQVNVTGTVNLFEAARAAGIKTIAYASSLAALGPPEDYDTWPLGDDALPNPKTLYGVYKVANEGTARVYAAENGVGSIGLRPHTVFGIGRDQGVTADCAKAILAASIGKAFHIRFGGSIALQHASDVALAFIGCADSDTADAHVCNQRYNVIEVGEFVATLKAIVPDAQITYQADAPLPFPSDLDDSGLRGLLGELPFIPLNEAISQDIAMYCDLVEKGQIDLEQLNR